MKKAIMVLLISVMAAAAQASLIWRGDLNGIPGTSTSTESGFTAVAVAQTSAGRTNGVYSFTMANVDGGAANSNMIFRQWGVTGGGSSNNTGFARNMTSTFSTNLYRDGIQFSGTNSASAGMYVSFANLTAGQKYDVTLWAYDYAFGNAATQTYYNVTGGGNTLLGQTFMPTANSSAAQQPNDLTDYSITGSSLTAGVDGSITIFIQTSYGVGAANQKLNGFQVTVVPEPVTVGMLGLGALVTLTIRRIKQ